MPSIYVHVPFCRRKCSYCAFYSVPLEHSRIKAYLESLQVEIQLRNKEITNNASSNEVTTLFIGGGTPTALSEEEMDVLLDVLTKGYHFEKNTELSIEGNPGTLTLNKLNLLRNYGINRISLGAQSLSDPLLKQLGRIHSAVDIQEGVRLVREAGFENLNLDLMFGLPGQSLKDWQNTLEEVLRLQPEHLSVYGLMVEENTPLAFNHELVKDLPDDELQAEMYDRAREFLKKEGYGHYETSNFALPGFECQHNLGYWQGKEYLGLGPGAVSYIQERRTKNIEDVEQYGIKLAQGRQPIDPEEDESLTEAERRSERIILGLRLAEGIDLKAFESEFNKNLMDIYPSVLERYLKAGVFSLKDNVLTMNSDYWFVANSVLQEFV